MEKEKEEENRRNRKRSGDDDDTDCEGSKARRKADSTAVADDDADIPPRREKYDVFISFRGEDTRLGITSHLHAALLQKKIETYIDNRLQRGKEIGPALLEAIEKSTISVIVFSRNYASSTWCLDELVHILKCKERYGQMVLPVFYDINPSDVRNQNGSYADAFGQLEKRFDKNIDKVHKWRGALKTAANLSGFDYSYKSGTEADLIKNVVDHIWTKLICESSCDLEGLVGIESCIQQIEELLGIHSHDACITVGIWGMGGIGKTTLAETVFHKLSSKFDASCFVKNVRENSEKSDGLDHLEKTLLKEILKKEGLSMGSTFVRDRLRRTKVLIVLDDVSDSIQLERLAGERLRYGTGSRIIITSRDKRTLTEEGKIYEVEGLKRDDALQLFCSHAFKNKSTPITDYKELAEKAVDYAGGIPLALKLLGSLFFNCKSKADWEDELDKLKEFPNEKLQRVLRLSYDALERNEKEIFLDIACFHKGNEVKEVRKRLAIHGRFAAAGIRVLVDMSLISIKLIGWEIIEMHDLLEELGRTIVQEQCIEDPGKRNRLFNDEDIYRVLKINKETPNVQAIMFDWSKIKKRPLKSADLKVMSNLKMLIVDSFVAPLDLPDSLRYLYWPSYPLESLPSNFSPENLVELHMRYSQVKKLCKEDQILVNLEVIDLKHSWYLTELPNLSESLKIVSIDLFGCRSLVEIPWSFQHLDKLTHLDVGGCTSLEYLPEMPRNIKYLDLQNSGIKELPESVWSHENISHLDITGCKDLEKLPSNKCMLKVSGCFNLDGCTSLDEFSELPRDISKLSLVGCKRLVSLPANICKLKYLEELNLSGCSKLQNFPEILEPMEHLKYLNLSQTAIKELRSSIEFLPVLKTLELQSCTRLSSIPKSICKLKYLEELNLSSCSKLKNFPEILEPMEHLKYLDLSQTAVEKLHLSIEFLPNIRRRSADDQSYYVLGQRTANICARYTLDHKLGQGQFGTTYLCTEIGTGSQYACKSIPKRKLLCKEDVDDVRREIQIMHHLAGHKNIVTIKGAYEDSLYVHIVMELCGGGELFDRIIQRGHYSERKAAELTRNIVGVVEACHSLGVMHRDLKPKDFLLVNKDDDFSLKAIDFGLSVFFKPGQVFTDVVGSPYYVAPEVLLKHYGPEADVWTAGVILYILLSGVPPFWAETQQGIFDAVLKGYIDFESEPWPLISNSAKDLIRKMLCSRPSDRLTAHEVLCHPWICENGVAPDRALDPAVLSRLKTFSAMNKLKKMALRVIAERLSEEEIAGLREMFQAMDTDNSGAITFDELKAGLRRYGSTMKDTEIRDLMDAADVDNSGTIDYGEFIAATVHLNKLEREEHLVAAFRYFDKDGSGYITVDELQQACTEHHMTDVLLEDIIKEVDQDNDGRIDYGEFVAMMQKGNVKGNMPIGRRTMRNSLNLSMRDAPGAH